jgi:hypothetical protein
MKQTGNFRPMAERTITARELNRAVLARQSLLERAPLPIPRMVERMAGLQAQYAPSMYIGLWSRVEAFERDDLTRALEARTVAQGTLQRTTIHLVSAGDYWPFALAVREARRAWWLRAHRLPDARAIEAAAHEIQHRLAGEGVLHRKDLDAAVAGLDVGGAIGLNVWLDLVRAPPSGTWDRRRADLFADAEGWLGPPKLDAGPALEHIVRRYLGGFGPSTAGEIANWAGLPVSDISTVLAGMRLRRFRAEDGAALVDLPRAPLPDPATPAPLRFLPTYDATLLAHARRAVIIEEGDREKVFSTKMPQSVGTFLVDGTVAGTWYYAKGRVEVEPFRKLDVSTTRELATEAERLTAFHAP